MTGNIGYERRLQALERRMREISAGVPISGWVTFTPGLYQGGVVASTISYARYCVIGKLLIAQARLSATAAGTATNSIQITGLPIARVTTTTMSGEFQVYTGTHYIGAAEVGGGGTSAVGIISGNTNAIGITPAITLSSGHILTALIIYEID